MPVSCPYCQNLIPYNRYVAGQVKLCPNCGARCRLPLWSAAARRKARAATRRTATRSDSRLLLPRSDQNEQFGKNFACPSCGRNIPPARLVAGPLGPCQYCHEDLGEIEPAPIWDAYGISELIRELDEKEQEAGDVRGTKASDPAPEMEAAAGRREEKAIAKGREAAKARPAAEWMRDEINAKGCLRQSYAAQEVSKRFGPEFVYENENHHPAIMPAVLEEFRKLTKKTVVWEKQGFQWRKRLRADNRNSRAVD